MSPQGTWLCTASLFSSAQRRDNTWGPPRGVAGAGGAGEMSSTHLIVTSLSHHPFCDTGQGKAHYSHQQPSDEEIGSCTSHTTRDEAEDQCMLHFLCGLWQRYMVRRRKVSSTETPILQNRFVSSSSVWELTALTVTVRIITLSLSVNEHSSYVVCVKRMRFVGEIIFNLQLQMQCRQNYHNSHQWMNDITGVAWGQVRYRWKKEKHLLIWWFKFNRRLHSTGGLF